MGNCVAGKIVWWEKLCSGKNCGGEKLWLDKLCSGKNCVMSKNCAMGNIVVENCKMEK